MPSLSSRTNEAVAWSARYANNDLVLGSEVKVRNVEFTEPQSHVFHGYTSKVGGHVTVNSDNVLHFHNPNKVDFDIRKKKQFEFNKWKNDHSEHHSQLKHLVAGGIAGCVASTVTCPLDVIKTRQQSSIHAQGLVSSPKAYLPKVGRTTSRSSVNEAFRGSKFLNRARRMQMSQVTSMQAPYVNKLVSNQGIRLLANLSILQHYRYIMNVEGPKALYKGLGPTLVGVVPSRSIYFFAYSGAKNFYTQNLGLSKDSSSLHLVSAASAGVCCTTATSPLWVIKTKLQLHRSVQSSMTVRQCCQKMWAAGGVKGFYRGMTASYAGILETVIHFVIYERLKLLHQRQKELNLCEKEKTWSDYAALMMIAAMSKTTATCIAYPHEVVRTRLREETTKRKYRGFFQTLSKVARQEGFKALYRGLGTQIVRQVPNMAIVMGTYEFIIDRSSRI